MEVMDPWTDAHDIEESENNYERISVVARRWEVREKEDGRKK